MKRCTNNHIHIWHFSFAPHHKADRYWNVLTKDEKERADRFYFDKDRMAWLFSRGILRTILSQYLGIKPDAIRFQYTSYGKPFLDPLQNPAGLHFNVSHTHHCILYAFTKNIDIGIDVEYLKSDIDHQGIAKNFFSPYEYQLLTNANHEQQNTLFYKIWTCKEAFIKAIGQGLSYPLADFDVAVQENEPAKVLNIKGEPHEANQWTLHSFTPADRYIAAIATRQPVQQITYYGYEISGLSSEINA